MTRRPEVPHGKFRRHLGGHPNLEFDKAERLAFEKEMLGLYVSDHPLMGLEKALRDVTDVTIRDLLDSAAGPTPRGNGSGYRPGRLDRERHGHDRRRRHRPRPALHPASELMATFVLEDLEAAIEVMVFPRRCSNTAASWNRTRSSRSGAGWTCARTSRSSSAGTCDVSRSPRR